MINNKYQKRKKEMTKESLKSILIFLNYYTTVGAGGLVVKLEVK